MQIASSRPKDAFESSRAQHVSWDNRGDSCCEPCSEPAERSFVWKTRICQHRADTCRMVLENHFAPLQLRRWRQQVGFSNMVAKPK